MSELTKRITNYLGNGGLVNPEMMEHEKVRDLLIDCREALRRIAEQDSKFMDNRRLTEWDISCYVCGACSQNEFVHGEYQMTFKHKAECPIEIARAALSAPPAPASEREQIAIDDRQAIEEIAVLCFRAGLKTPDGTVLPMVKQLIAARAPQPEARLTAVLKVIESYSIRHLEYVPLGLLEEVNAALSAQKEVKR